MDNKIKEKMTIGKAKKILRGFLAKDCYYETPLYYAIPYILDYITNLQEENDKFDETMKDIKDNLIARINRQECEIHNLQQRIDKAIKVIEENVGIIFNPFSKEYSSLDEMTKSGIGEIWYILQGSDKE